MDALNAASLCALLLSPPHSVPSCTPNYAATAKLERWDELVSQAAARFHIPPVWISAVMRLESAGYEVLNGRPTTSKVGAMGLMQLMPATYEDMRIRYALGSDAYAPRDNIFAAAAYLRLMFDRYGYPNLFAAYHAGPGRLDAFLLGRAPLPAATVSYLNTLVPGAEITRSPNENPAAPSQKSNMNSLFFVRAEGGISSSGRGGLFVPLSVSAR